MCWHWNVSHVLYIHSCVLYIHPCAVHRAVFCPSHLTLSLHMPSSMKCFPSDCKTSWVVLLRVWLLVSTLEEESTKRKETKQWRVLVDWIPLQDAFFSSRNCMSRTNSLAGKGLSMLFIWCAVSTQSLPFIPRSRMCSYRKLKLQSKVCSYSKCFFLFFVFLYISRSALAYL